MKYVIDRVNEMHTKFDFPREIGKDNKLLRGGMLAEEVSEFLIADSFEDELDALLDLIIFAAGTIDMMRIPSETVQIAFDRIMDANMKKVKGVSKRGSRLPDLMKPAGWEAPTFDDLNLESCWLDAALGGKN